MTYRRMIGAVVAIALTATLGLPALTPAAAQPPGLARAATSAACSPESTVKETLPNGTTWQLCWRMQEQSGLVLEKVFISSQRYPRPVQVLDSITLAQLNVPYDSGTTEYNDITDYGFGGADLKTLAGDDCKGGSARLGSDGGADPQRRTVLCVSAEPSGLAYHLQNDEAASQPYSKQGSDLVLRAISKVGWYEYVTEYRLADSGQISARLGATGDLSPTDFVKPDRGWPIGKGPKDYASNHYHSAFWRVDFNLDGRGREQVEQFDTRITGSGPSSAILKTGKTAITKEGSFAKVNRRWWRLVSRTSKNTDGHRRSYELSAAASDVYEAHPETTPDVTFTQKHACEKFATGNTDPECGARRTILNYARNKETMTDPVMWVRVGFHHVPRDEDQSPMPLHWQGFDLTPRDFTNMNLLTPPERTGVNGHVHAE